MKALFVLLGIKYPHGVLLVSVKSQGIWHSSLPVSTRLISSDYGRPYQIKIDSLLTNEKNTPAK